MFVLNKIKEYVLETNQSKVAILMATYQGEKYIGEQLQSLLKQTFAEWELYVCDDGSTDATPLILNEYAERDRRIHIMAGGVHKGAKRNFMDMLSAVEATYYMFCDQDDVWLPMKVECTLKEMEQQEREHPHQPVVIYSDLYVVDDKLNIISSSFWKYSHINPDAISFNEIGVRCVATGCTMMMNRKVRSCVLPMPEVAKMHDVWITLVIAKNGGVLYPIRTPLIYYRQHASNVIGAARETKWSVWSKLTSLKKLLRENWRQYKMLQYLNYGSGIKYMYYKFLYFCH